MGMRVAGRIVIVVTGALLGGCGSGWKNLPSPPPAPRTHVTMAALAPDRPYALPDLPPPAPPPPWPSGESVVLDEAPVPALPARDPVVLGASKLVLEETWSGLGGSGFRRVTLVRDGGPGFAFTAEGEQGYRGTTRVTRRGRISDDRVRRVTVRIAALGRHETGVAREATCRAPVCGSGSLGVYASAGGREVGYTNALNPCEPEWQHGKAAMTLDVPGAREAVREVLALTVDAAKPTHGDSGVTFTD